VQLIRIIFCLAPSIDDPFLPRGGMWFAIRFREASRSRPGVAIMEPELKCEECGQPITVLRCWQACRTEKRAADDLPGSPAADKRRKLSSEELALALWRTGKAESLMDAICSDALTELARRGMIIQGLPPRLTERGKASFKRMQAGREEPGLDPRRSFTRNPAIPRGRETS
jgi:hypothetical protein